MLDGWSGKQHSLVICLRPFSWCWCIFILVDWPTARQQDCKNSLRRSWRWCSTTTATTVQCSGCIGMILRKINERLLQCLVYDSTHSFPHQTINLGTLDTGGWHCLLRYFCWPWIVAWSISLTKALLMRNVIEIKWKVISTLRHPHSWSNDNDEVSNSRVPTMWAINWEFAPGLPTIQYNTEEVHLPGFKFALWTISWFMV